MPPCLNCFYDIAAAALTVFVIAVFVLIASWIIDKIKEHKKYKSIRWLNENLKTTAISTHILRKSAESIYGANWKRLKAKVLGASVSRLYSHGTLMDVWVADIKIGKGKFRGEIHLDPDYKKLFATINFMGELTDIILE